MALGLFVVGSLSATKAVAVGIVADLVADQKMANKCLRIENLNTLWVRSIISLRFLPKRCILRWVTATITLRCAAIAICRLWRLGH